MFERIRIVLVSTSHPGNIGATARAMKNMGFSSLYLVRPKDFPHCEATVRSAGADDILEKAVVCQSLEEAIAGCHRVYGTTARNRSLAWPALCAKELAAEVNQLPAETEIAILFGNETHGLSNVELEQCHSYVFIPTQKHFSSLNVASAVLIVVYELFLATQSAEMPGKREKQDSQWVSMFELNEFLQHVESTLIRLRFLNPEHPRLLMRRLRRLIYRLGLEKNELNILRGILSTVDKHLE